MARFSILLLASILPAAWIWAAPAVGPAVGLPTATSLVCVDVPVPVNMSVPAKARERDAVPPVGLPHKADVGARLDRPASDSDAVQLASGPGSPEATAVLDYVRSIQGKQMLAGHHVVYGSRIRQDLNFIITATGKHPALVEFEIGIFERKYRKDFDNAQKQLVRDAIQLWKQGTLIAVCWHWGNPSRPENTYANTKVGFDIRAALREGTPERVAMLKDLDVTARALKELRDANVPVLFRPLHEICGGWFWWGMQGKQPAQELWKFVFQYFTEHHQLKNLIWVYSASQQMRTDWFPGVEYADVIGVDIYRDGEQDERNNYDRMSSIAGGKPVALTECDVIPDPDVLRERKFLWSWFTTWHGPYLRKNEAAFLRHVYNHELVITRDELPRFVEMP